MASDYRIHRPYVLATLPRPLDYTDGRIVAGEVYGLREGQAQSQKKRKRTELAVGIDGETASIYDVPASRLITSYPIPPQESFTCPPHSLRLRRNGHSDVYRYTYAATRDAKSRKLTLFKDVVHADGKTTSTSTTQTLRTSPVRYLTSSRTSSDLSSAGSIIAVSQKGEVTCVSGETLAVQWSASAKAAVQDAVASSVDGFQVDFVTSESLSELRDGMFKDKHELLSVVPKSMTSQPEVLVAVSRSTIAGREARHLVVMAAVTGTTSADAQSLIPLEVLTLPQAPDQDTGTSVYQFDGQTGCLLQLFQGSLSVYSVTGAVPKLKSVVQMEEAVSFTRLSRPFILSSSPTSMGLFNYQYRSVHARSALDLSELPAESQGSQSIQILAYFRSQNLAVALVDNVLVSIKVEPPQSKGRKRRGALLVDSIGRGAAVEIAAKKQKSAMPSSEFSQLVPGTVTSVYLEQFHTDTARADGLLHSGFMDEWDNIFREKFSMKYKKPAVANGHDATEPPKNTEDYPEWKWLAEPSRYPSVDRRWVLYAISQAFSIEPAHEDKPTELIIFLPDNNVTTYLVLAGHMSLANIRSAFREDLQGQMYDHSQLARDLVKCLAEADPSLALLLNYLQATKLGEVELLHAIRTLLRSMDLLRDNDKIKTLKGLMAPSAEVRNETDDADEMELDNLERELAVTERYLGDDSSDRSRGLTLAFTKLWRLPALGTIKALRATLQTEEILSLISLLRVELVRGAWTSLYLDPTSFDAEGLEPPPDGVIALIADLMSRCIDAIGPAGWLVNDAMSRVDASADTGDFLTALKLEVTAALEGLQEATYLHGVLGEAVRYGEAQQQSLVAASRAPRYPGDRPITMAAGGAGDGRMLPLGLKARQMPTQDKVVSGGEVVKRSVRERGHLISQKVAAYSLEKLTI